MYSFSGGFSPPRSLLAYLQVLGFDNRNISCVPMFAHYQFHSFVHIIESSNDPFYNTNVHIHQAHLHMDLLRLGEYCGDNEVTAVLTRDGRGWMGNILAAVPAQLPADTLAGLAGTFAQRMLKATSTRNAILTADGGQASGKSAFTASTLCTVLDICPPTSNLAQALHKRLRCAQKVMAFFTRTKDNTSTCITETTLHLTRRNGVQGVCGARIRVAAFCAELSTLRPICCNRAEREEVTLLLQHLGVPGADRKLLWQSIDALRLLCEGTSVPMDDLCERFGVDEYTVIEGRIPLDTSNALQQVLYCTLLDKVADWVTDSAKCTESDVTLTFIDPPSSTCHLHEAVARMLRSQFISTVFEKEVFEALADGVRCPKIQPPQQTPEETMTGPNPLTHIPSCLSTWVSTHPLLATLSLPTTNLYSMMQAFSEATCFYVRCIRADHVQRDVTALELPRIIRRLATLLPARVAVDVFAERYGDNMLGAMRRSPVTGEWHVGQAKVWMSKRTLASIERSFLMTMGGIAVAAAAVCSAVEKAVGERVPEVEEEEVEELCNVTDIDISADTIEGFVHVREVSFEENTEERVQYNTQPRQSRQVVSVVSTPTPAPSTFLYSSTPVTSVRKEPRPKRSSSTSSRTAAMLSRTRENFQKRQAASLAQKNKENAFAQTKVKFAARIHTNRKPLGTLGCATDGAGGGGGGEGGTCSAQFVPSIVALQERRNLAS